MSPAPHSLANTMSNALSTPPRAGSADARAITMKEVQISTVTTAAAQPMALGDTEAKGWADLDDILRLSGTPVPPRLSPDNRTMQVTDIIGFLAAALTTSSFVPQAIHTFRTKDVSGVSLGMYSAFTLGVSLWLLYGWILNAWPIVIANLITLSLASSILVMKLRYR